MPLEVELVAELASIKLSFSEMQSIKLGSLLDLGPAQAVDMRINGHVALRGDPGESRGCHSVRITEQVNPAPPLHLVTDETSGESFTPPQRPESQAPSSPKPAPVPSSVEGDVTSEAE